MQNIGPKTTATIDGHYEKLNVKSVKNASNIISVNDHGKNIQKFSDGMNSVLLFKEL
jgi:hypothetical protein